MKRGQISSILILMALLCGVLPAAGAPVQNVKVHLPFIQRSVPPHPNAPMLRLVGQAGFDHLGDACGWDAGVLASGWAKMWEATGDEQYWDWLRNWLDGCLARSIKIEHVNDVPLAYAAAVVNARAPRADYMALVNEGADYIFNRAPRSQDGALIHLANMVWDDTLVVVIPFLLRLWDDTGDAHYLDEAVAQVQRHAAHLQDGATGLYRHAWSEPANTFSGPFYWGRGNGWVIWAQAELLVALPTGDARQPALLDQFLRQATALVSRQAPGGMWHTIVTRSDFYLETSATALITAGLTTAAVHGMFNGQAADAAANGRNVVWRQVGADGVVAGVSGPTGPMSEESAYNTIPIEEFNLYGQGAVLLMGAASMSVP